MQAAIVGMEGGLTTGLKEKAGQWLYKRVISSRWSCGDRLRGGSCSRLDCCWFRMSWRGYSCPMHGLAEGPGSGPGTFTSRATRSASTWAAAVASIEASWWWWWWFRVSAQSWRLRTSWQGYSWSYSWPYPRARTRARDLHFWGYPFCVY